MSVALFTLLLKMDVSFSSVHLNKIISNNFAKTIEYTISQSASSCLVHNKKSETKM